MQSGDIFELTAKSISDMETDGKFSTQWAVGKGDNRVMHKLQPGMKFRITTKGIKKLPVEVSAGRLDPVTGKGIKGRPRRFPAAVVAELLGESAPVVAPTVDDDDTDLSTVSTEPDDTVEANDDEENEAHVRNMLGLQPKVAPNQNPTPVPYIDGEDNW